MGPRWLVVLGTAAVVMVFVLPPAGLALGVVTIVQAVRLMRATRPEEQELLRPDGTPVLVKVGKPGRANAVVALGLGVTATALGALVTALIVLLWSEVSDYSECRDSTLTTQGQKKCDDALREAILDRFGQ